MLNKTETHFGTAAQWLLRIWKQCSRTPFFRIVLLGSVFTAAIAAFYTVMHLAVLKSFTDSPPRVNEIPFIASAIAFTIHLVYLLLVARHVLDSHPPGHAIEFSDALLLATLCLAYVFPAGLLMYMTSIEETEVIGRSKHIIGCVKTAATTIFFLVYVSWAWHALQQFFVMSSENQKEVHNQVEAFFWLFIDITLASVLALCLLAYFGILVPEETNLVLGTVWKTFGIKEVAALCTILAFAFTKISSILQRMQIRSAFAFSLFDLGKVRSVTYNNQFSLDSVAIGSNDVELVDVFPNSFAIAETAIQMLGIEPQRLRYLVHSDDVVNATQFATRFKLALTRETAVLESLDNLQLNVNSRHVVVLNDLASRRHKIRALNSFLKELPANTLLVITGPAPRSLFSLASRASLGDSVFPLRSPVYHRWDLYCLADLLHETKFVNVCSLQPKLSKKRSGFGYPNALLHITDKLDSLKIRAMTEEISWNVGDSVGGELRKHFRYSVNHGNAIPSLTEVNLDAILYCFRN